MKNLLFTLAVAGLSFSMAEASFSSDDEQESVDWKRKAEELGLDETAVAQLERDRILVTRNAYNQIFMPYLKEGPLFITSDSLLNAYHVIYEESIFRMESTVVGRLPGFLREILTNIDQAGSKVIGNPELLEKARTRAKLVTGIAMRLMDDSFYFGDPELDAILDAEAARITAAEGMSRPEWLGPFDESFQGIDYNRCKPRGFYTRNERLSRYFRATS